MRSLAFWRTAPKEPIFDPTNVLVIGGYDVAAGFVKFVGFVAICLVVDVVYRRAWKKPDQPDESTGFALAAVVAPTPSTSSVLKD